ncbi:hypothetical protein DBT_2233 [Dissulfuribacter thermophilus]|uniref:RNA-binding protein n=1 Tax=Dissulfuribacter thermophilus TaxID=1156395 RepID=A0A1B9F364_9BACT|nr:CooT family nickel-binding protein [Dissulfuribacter thermophilus]OCC14360.1 hypothetical protein DBT_2233 [Dissulfuribacter thermophilus]
MCQSSVFLIKDGNEQEILKDAILVEPVEDGVKIQALFEAPQVVKAKIEKIDLLKHKIILKEVP